jgi:hypothetical protein
VSPAFQKHRPTSGVRTPSFKKGKETEGYLEVGKLEVALQDLTACKECDLAKMRWRGRHLNYLRRVGTISYEKAMPKARLRSLLSTDRSLPWQRHQKATEQLSAKASRQQPQQQTSQAILYNESKQSKK